VSRLLNVSALLVLLGVSLVSAGCVAQSRGGSDTTATVGKAATPSSVAAPGAPYQVVVLGPGRQQAAPQDDAPRLFAAYPELRKSLETALLETRVRSGHDLGSRLGLGIYVLGATQKGSEVRVFADKWEQAFTLVGWQPVQGGGGAGPIRLRLRQHGRSFELLGVDRPGDGSDYAPSLRALFPAWALTGSDRHMGELQRAVYESTAAWARRYLPDDAFVAQPASEFPDPHGHKPPTSAFRMIAPKYGRLAISTIDTPSPDVIDGGAPISSVDRRFQLLFLVQGNIVTVVHDTVSGRWYAITAPGDEMGAVDGAVSFDPAWRGHHLFVDFETETDPYIPTTTHYEIDFDRLQVVRAVPMGPLSLNPPVSRQ
jgi:hypothetical protein